MKHALIYQGNGESISGRNSAGLFFGSLAAAVVFRFSELVACVQVFLIARRAVCHVFPAAVALGVAGFGGALTRVEQPCRTRTTVAIGVRIRSENRLLNLLLDTVPLLFWRFRHVNGQNIMARFQEIVSSSTLSAPWTEFFAKPIEPAFQRILVLPEFRADLKPRVTEFQQLAHSRHLFQAIFFDGGLNVSEKDALVIEQGDRKSTRLN